MKRSMIAVCLLLLSPARVWRAIEDHNRVWAGTISSRQRGPATGSTQTILRDTVMMSRSLPEAWGSLSCWASWFGR